MVTLTKFAEIGMCGDSLTTGNEGFLGAVRLNLQLYATLASAFSGGYPVTQGAIGLGVAAPGVTVFNHGAPTWHISALDAQTIQQIRNSLMPALPSNVTHLFFEGGTNDVTGSVNPATSNTNLVGAMTDAIVQFPNLQAFFYVGVACAGELYTNPGVPAFSGNTLLGGTVDAAIDSLMATLRASVQAQTGTNKLGQPISFVYLDMRTAAVTLLAANEPPPWMDSGFLTVDGRHPTVRLQDVFQTVALANLTIVP